MPPYTPDDKKTLIVVHFLDPTRRSKRVEKLCSNVLRGTAQNYIHQWSMVQATHPHYESLALHCTPPSAFQWFMKKVWGQDIKKWWWWWRWHGYCKQILWYM